MANPACGDADEDLVRAYFGHGRFFPSQRPFLNRGR
jgi:hypothetical protein